MTSTNVTLDRTVSLPGGVICSGLSASTATWAYPNIHGDVTFAVNRNGVVEGPFLYDPFGQALGDNPNTNVGDFDSGWLGQFQRPVEHQPELEPTLEMGARPYRPDLGRFLRVDPIDGGATFSDYAYVFDPINAFDLNGNLCAGREGSKGGCGVDFTGSGRLSHSRIAPVTATIASGFTLGIDPGYCPVICLPEFGISGEGPYIRFGVGFSWDMPSVVYNPNENPACGAEYTILYAGFSVGPVNITASKVKQGRSAGDYGDWELNYPTASLNPYDWRNVTKIGPSFGYRHDFIAC